MCNKQLGFNRATSCCLCTHVAPDSNLSGPTGSGGVMGADVEDMSERSVDAASGMTEVRLNGLHIQLPAWGRTVGQVASLMSNARWFTRKGKVGGACYSVRTCSCACPRAAVWALHVAAVPW